MNNALSIVTELVRLGGRVYVEDGRLKTAAPPGVITAALGAAIRTHKDELMALLGSARDEALSKDAPIVRREPGRALLSHGQQRLWLIDQMGGGASAQYHMPTVLELRGELNVALLQQALLLLVQRHEVLRTTYASDGDHAWQEVQEVATLALPVLAVEDEAAMEMAIEAEAGRPFNLRCELPLRAQLLRLAPQRHVLVLVLHHIASDGWSGVIAVTEFCQAYVALVEGRAPGWQALPVQYADYARWQREAPQQARHAQQLTYWQQKLASLPEVHSLPLDHPRPAQQSFEGALLHSRLDAQVSSRLHAVCREHGATLFMGLHAALSALLSRYSGASDIVLGTPVANREQPEIAGLIGFFVNTLVLRAELTEDMSFGALLQQCRQTNLEAYANQQLPFDRLVEALQPQRSLSYSPLFQVMLSLQNNEEESGSLPGLTVSSLAAQHRTAQFDLTLDAEEEVDGLQLSWEYSTDLFDAATVARFAASFEFLLSAMLAQLDAPISSLSCLPPAERSRLLALSGKDVAESTSLLLPERCARVARLHPDLVAVEDGVTSLSYGALDVQSNRLAHALLQRGVGRDDFVAFCVGRSVLLPVTALGIMKAGAAYIPLTAEVPVARVADIITDAKVRWLIADGEQRHLLSGCGATVLDLSELLLDAALPDTAPALVLVPEQLAYATFTSGTTGRPKGVMIEHGGLAAIGAAWDDIYQLALKGDRWLQMANANFDVFAGDLVRTLGFGNTLVICPRAVLLDAQALTAWLHDERITAAEFVPAVLRELCAYLEESASSAPPMRLLVVGSDSWYGADQARVRAAFGVSPRLINTYGVTEATIDSSYHEGQETGQGMVPIGRPFAGSCLYVLDAALALVAPGVKGELCIGGPGVARGYLGLPQLSAEKFVRDPYSQSAGARLYRTGDLARIRVDGVIELVGRADNQIKLRGFRIELGEIETALLQIAGIRQAVVNVYESQVGEKRLAAYVVAEPMAWSADAVRAQLASTLPDYMVPTALMCLAALPVTSNGKIDRKALPAPTIAAEQAFVAPATACELWLADVWSSLLKPGRPVSAADNFFALGGHSLLAMRVIAKVRQERQAALPITAVFEAQTLAALALRIEQAGPAEAQPIVHRGPGRAPLSHGQQRLWLIDQMGDGASVQYHMPMALELRGELNVALLQQALQLVVQRHEILRTTYASDGDHAWQEVQEVATLALPVLAVEDEAAMEMAIEAEAGRPFNLRCELPLRAQLLRLAPQRHVLVLVLHHIASDGWSGAIAVDEWCEAYAALVEGRAPGWQALPVQYADYARWQREAPQQARHAQQLTYWQQKLASLPEVHSLPLDHPRPAQQSFEGALLHSRLDAQVSSRLRAVCREHGATLFMGLHAALSALLSRYSGASDIVLGTPVANREQPEIAGLIGFFVNTLVLRAELTEDMSFGALLQQCRQTNLEAYANQQLPFDRLVEALQPQRSLSYSPLFQVMLSLQNNEEESGSLPGLTVSSLAAQHRTAQFDLTLDAEEEVDGLQLSWEYSTDLFDAATVARFAASFEFLLSAMLAQLDAPISSLSCLPPAERSRLLALSGKDVAESTSLLLPERCARVARLHPDLVAVEDGVTSLSYGALDVQSNRLAHALLQRGVGRDDFVAFCVGRSVLLPVTALGIMKAGAAYIPLTAEVPVARVADIITDAKVRWLIADGEQRHLLSGCGATVLDLSELLLDAALPDTAPALVLVPEQLAYATFTSGTTGRPKGVMIEHGGLAAIGAAWDDIYQLALKGDRWLQMANANFDVFAGDLVRTLGFGNTLVICPRAVLLDAQALTAWLHDERITAAEFVPAVLRELCAYLEESASSAPPMRLLVVGSDSWYGADQARVRAAFGVSPRLINTYGVTEATIDSSYHEGQETGQGMVPIGRPFAGSCLYVLDAALALVAPGVKGELCIGGPGVARGYLGLPQLSAEKFVRDPYSQSAGGRLYRTGDLARIRADGVIELVGRADNQIKLRGFRIELGEIETALLQIAGIRQAVVNVYESQVGEKRLAAYVVAEPMAWSADAVRAQLASTLPDYMVPTALMCLAALPVTSNGKIDRKALPAPTIAAEQAFVAPATACELWLADVWSSLLKPGRPVSAADNFFALGGHSLLAMRVIAKVRQERQAALPITAVFEAQTLAALALRIEQAGPAEAQPIVHRGPGRAPLSHGQQRLWLIDQMGDGASVQYHMPMALELRGELNVALLQQALQLVVQRHEILRTTYASDGDHAWQEVQEVATLALPVLAVEDEAAMEMAIEAEAGRPFNLRCELPLRAQLLRLAPQRHVLVLVLHHIASDGWSGAIAVDEWCEAYAALVEGRAPGWQALPVQYADYARWQREAPQQARHAQQLTYWQQKLASLPEVHSLPLDHPRPAQQSFEGALLHSRLDAQVSSRLRAVCREHGATLFMGLHAALSALLSRYSGASDIVLGTPVANREQPEIAGLIGFFVNTLVLRAELTEDMSFGALLQQCRQTNLEAYANQQLPFDRLVEALQPQRSLSYSPLFQVMLSLQNNEEESGSLPGLTVSSLATQQHTAQFDLMLNVEEDEDSLQLSWEYSTDLFDASTVARMADSFACLLDGALTNPQRALDTLPLMAPAERERLLQLGRATQSTVPAQCLHQLFTAQALATPQAVALTDGKRHWTYAELEAASNQLAHRLLASGAAPGARVGLCLERSGEVVQAILAILKCGAAYVPLDPIYPAERIAYMLDDAAVTLVVAQVATRASAGTGTVVLLDDDADGTWPVHAPQVAVSATAQAYVIYTSGSTGKPKGVMVSHANVARLLTSTEGWFGFGAADTWCLFHSYAFDFSVWEIWGALLHGGRLVVVPRAVAQSTPEFYQLVREQGVTVLNQTPTAFYAFMEEDRQVQALLALRWVVFGGEALALDKLLPWFELHADTAPQLVNMYGITETTVHVTYRAISRADAQANRGSLIGRPIPDLTLWLLDRHGEPVPTGVVGELCVGGSGVAEGYLNRPELTAERFVSHPALAAGERLYRSGDLARMTADDELEYLGRGDHQVKIRGFRIELGEIESALRGCEGVDDAVVLAEKGSAGQVRLVAYVLNAQAVIDSAPLRARLGQSLPDYMVPSIFMAVAAWPLTANGKLDVKALPDARERFQVEYLAPRTEVEVKLAEIWAEILELEQVSVTANFFAQGGDSIRAVRLIARCGQEGFALAVRDLFAYQSIELMANAISSRSTATTHLAVDAGPFSLLTPEERVLVDVAKYEDGYPLTQLQEGMVFHNQRDGDYLIIDSVKLERPWSEAALQEALTGMMTRHEILRTVFDYDIGYRPLQLVLRNAPLPLQVHDWRHLEATESEAKFATWYDCQVANTSVFDGKAPLWSIDVHCVSDAVFHYTLIHHHAILDGWSVSSFNTELFQRYLEVQRLLPEIARSSLPPYRHYVAQELASLADPKARAFWGEMIASATMPTWEAGKRLTAQSAHLDLSTRGEQLRELCARLGVAPRTVLLAVYLKVLAFLNGAESITSSVTGHGRLEVAGADRSLGLFLSTLPICTNIDQPSWSVLISAVDSQLQQAWNYRHYPVSQLQRDSGVDLSAALFNYTDFHVYDGVNGDGISGMDTFEVTNYRLLCHWTHDPRQGQLNLSISADAGLYSTEALQHVMINFERALDAALLCTNEPVWTASLMAPAERERLLQLGRATQSTAPAQCLHQLFTAQALAMPQAVALIDGERHWTYAELEAASNQLAHRLLASGAAPGARVGLCLERSGEVVQAILAILKCGAAYVPLDPIYPAERIAYMLDDAAVTLVVAQVATRASAGTGTVVLLDDADGTWPVHAPQVAVSATAQAYVIYTSGSTGKPKGVMVSHANVARLLTSTEGWFGFGAADTWCLFHSYAFDFSVWEIWGALLHGGRLVVVPRAVAQSTPEFYQLVREQGVTVLNQTPTAFYAFMEEDRQVQALLALRWVVFGGEALALDKLLPWFELHADTAPQLVNMYGITETTVHVTYRAISRADAQANRGSLIGRPIPDLTLWLLDRHGEPVPTGVVGELCVGGSGVAEGYLNRPELTAERFVSHPALAAGERLYRSGDLARMTADDELEYLGRGDHQVKIRGFRIELGEIESALRGCEGVDDAVVLAEKGSAGQVRLVAYVLNAQAVIDSAPLRAQLRQSLPDYMVPSIFMAVAAWPLTANGKLDVKVLPQLERDEERAYEAPQGDVEQALSDVWVALLKVDRVGRNDHFFSMGGDSLLAMRFASQCRKAGLPIAVRDIFVAPTIQMLAVRVINSRVAVIQEE